MGKTVLSSLLLLALLLCMLSFPAAATEEEKTPALDALFTTADLMDATVSQLLTAMEEGRLSAQELVQMYLDRIAAYDKACTLNSILSLNPNAMEEARLADEQRAAGGELGRLHGIPVLVKDNINVENMATTCGDPDRAYAIAASDATVVARLREEGAIILGKTNMAEYALGGHVSSSPLGGTVHNPYDLSRTSAGSSGGSAVAMSCNFAALSLGTDTGASIRRPSSFSNIVGMRPSYGLVSQSGLYRLNSYVDTIGPMCRSVEDLALMLDVITGTDEKDGLTANADSYLPGEGFSAHLDASGLAGKRIGYLANSFGYYCSIYSNKPLETPITPSPALQPLVENAKNLLVQAGAELVDLSPYLKETQIQSLGSSTQRAGMLYFREVMHTLFQEQEIDAIVYLSQTDIPATVARSFEDAANNPAAYINYFSPVAGLPEIMVPMGFTEETEQIPPLPLGLSFFADYGEDATLIEIAYAFEQASQARRQPPATPPLPDPALNLYGETLLAELESADLSVYTEESRTAVQEALLAAKGADPAQTASYQQLLRSLTLAWDALQEAPPETVQPTEAATPSTQSVPSTASDSAEPPSPENEAGPVFFFPIVTVFCLLLLAGIAVFLYKDRKRSKEKEHSEIS